MDILSATTLKANFLISYRHDSGPEGQRGNPSRRGYDQPPLHQTQVQYHQQQFSNQVQY